MSSSLVRTFAFASIAILGTITAGCHTTYISSAPAHPPEAHVEAPPPEPVHVHRYTYVHYPSCNVYFEHERNLWFWFDGHEWRMGAVLPSHFHIDHREAVTFEFENEHPYERVVAPPTPAFEHGPPPHAPAYGHERKFTYVHYPSCNVYFDRERRLWFWSEGRDWRMGAELPPRFHVNEHEAVKVELENEKPYEHGNAFRAAHENNGKAQGKFSNDVHDKEVRHVAIDVPKNGGKATSHDKHDAPDLGPSGGASDHDSHGASSNDSGSDNHGGGSGDTHGASSGDNHGNGNDTHGSSADDGHGNGNAKDASGGDDKGNKPSGAQGQGSNDNKSDAHGKPDNSGTSNGQNNGPSGSPSNGQGKGNGKDKDKDKGKPSKD